ncbi:SPFH domain-containing protein [Candidatus Gracilibacteria bacterium]|nr:SPFH domain-containing protein [Candidatus Gracilibacteria bacterium]
MTPGFVFLIPFAETLQRRHVRQQTIRFQKQEILITGNLVFEVSAMIRFQINDVYKALFVIEELEDSLKDFVSGVLRDIIQGKSVEDLADTEAISQELLQKLESVQEEWGVRFMESKLTSCAPTQQSAKLITIEEEGRRKAQVAKFLLAEYPGLKSILPALVGTPITMTANSSGVSMFIVEV